MTARGLAISLGVAAFGVMVSGCAASQTAATDASTALLQSRCTVCHGIERINAARHDRAGWEATIGRMRGKGARLSDAETAALVGYLTNREVPLPSGASTPTGGP
jgi:mono/diheme cytochrome c family protein